MPSMADAMAAAATVFVVPVSFATFSISSCLFIIPPKNCAGADREPWCANAQRLYASDSMLSSKRARDSVRCRVAPMRGEPVSGRLAFQALDRFRERVVGRGRRVAKHHGRLVHADRG